MSSNSSLKKPSKRMEEPRPSASILLISPRNEVLLLHRVQHSRSFPSAHVFPGGNLSSQDGKIPESTSLERHYDGDAYRIGAIRECFEESGLLLAKKKDDIESPHNLLYLADKERETGRKLIHQGKVTFLEWLAERGGSPDTGNLVPFTHWITPKTNPRRFTTQMYLYFLPPTQDLSSSSAIDIPRERETVIPLPTHDGGIEHTAARFLPASDWLSLAQTGEIILFPPQYFLLHLIAPFLTADRDSHMLRHDELLKQREALMKFVNSGDPPWTTKFISPSMWGKYKDGRVILSLDKPGPELQETECSGDPDRVVILHFKKEGPRNLEVLWRKDIAREQQARKEKL